MPVDFKAKLDQFLNSLIAKGTPVAEIDAARIFYIAHPDLIQPTAEGVLAQDELSRRLAEVSSMETTLRTRQGEWGSYIERANQTLATNEREKSEAIARAAAADASIKALAAQYNIAEEDVRAIYNPTTTPSNPTTPTNPNFNPNQFNPTQLRVNQERDRANQNPNGVTRDDLVGLINDIGRKDSINARHFTLTGKPWDSSKSLEYIKEQATLGKQVDIETAWRVTENIDSLEATALTTAKAAERAAIEAEVREKIAKENPTPLDATPQFSETHLAQIFQTSAANADPNVPKEVVGHHGRTREAVAALNRLRIARQLGQKSPYEQTIA